MRVKSSHTLVIWSKSIFMPVTFTCVKIYLTEDKMQIGRIDRDENRGAAMLSDTLTEGLGQYAIGPKIRALRLGKKLGLAQLGAHTGLSPAMLSKIERSRVFPTLPTLLRIALVFGVGLEHFFMERTDRPMVTIVRAKDRLRLPARPDNSPPAYLFESLDFPVNDRKLEGYLAEFPSGSASSEPHSHDGAELVYVLRGRLVISIDGEDHTLNASDSIYFDPAVPHGYRCGGRTDAAAVVVVTARGEGRPRLGG
jgi:quercetin dioxygenase-like cupin family protein/DNA-binding XRE family transcriptional regulator